MPSSLGIGVQPLLHYPCREAQGLATRGRFQRLEVDRLGGFAAGQPFKLFGQVVGQGLGECGFS
jgi:hypothetical protein